VLIGRFNQKLGAVGDSDGQGLRWQVIGHVSTAYDDQQVASWRVAWDVAPEGQPPAAASSAPATPALAASASAASAPAALASALPLLALAASVPAAPALAALAPAASPSAASSSSAVGPADGQQHQSQAPPSQELVALRFLRHSEALKEAAKAYSLGAALGNGTFGEVFAGTRKADNLPVAIKRLRSTAGDDFLGIVAEAVILDRLRGHPHVVQLLDAFELGKKMHLVLEHGGRSLHEMLKTRPSVAQIRSVAAHLNDALAFVHSIGLVHADLKPANVVVAAVGRNWTCRLADFGNALEARGAAVAVGGWAGWWG
jgi:hypothetical protein